MSHLKLPYQAFPVYLVPVLVIWGLTRFKQWLRLLGLKTTWSSLT